MRGGGLCSVGEKKKSAQGLAVEGVGVGVGARLRIQMRRNEAAVAPAVTFRTD